VTTAATRPPGPIRRGRARPRAPVRRVPSLVVAAWGALFFNVMTFMGTPETVIPLPPTLGQMLTQAALPLALVLALAANPRAVIRPNLFLVLLTLLGVVALMVGIHAEFMTSSIYRAARAIGFVTVLWLLTPWWGRRDMLLLRIHRLILWILIGVVIVGAVVSPGHAFAFEGRLAGVIWPIPPTQVAHYGAVLFGTSVVLWMCRVIADRHAMVALAVSGAIIIATHTRTALLAMTVALVVASASLFLGHVRVRRVSALGALGAILVATLFASEVTAWALRGQTTQEASQLTGRTKVWQAVFDADRPRVEQLFGSGMSDQSFNGLPVDSSWVGAYLDSGWFGIVVQASILLLLLLMAATRERGPQRAAALFLIVYCLVASIAEAGLNTPSPYILDLAVAAALLVPEARGGRT
jgi:O-antigen ligase